MSATKVTEEHIELAVIAHWTANDRDEIEPVAQAIADAEERGRQAGIREAAASICTFSPCETKVLSLLAPEATSSKETP